VDDPRRLAQEAFSFPLGAAGHLAVVGGPGSGKTTLVRTLITSLCLDHSPADLACYLVDGGGGLLKPLLALPQVGAVVLGDETERMARLWWMLGDEVARRQARLAGAGTQTWAELKRRDPNAPPALVVVVDNYPAFAALYEEIADALPRFAEQCAGAGIHLVVTTAGQLPYRLTSSFALKVALELTDPGQYPDVVGDTRVDADTGARLLPAHGVRGRGLVGNLAREFQTALPDSPDGAGPGPDAGNATAEAMAAAWRATGMAPAAPVDPAPERLGLGTLLRPNGAPPPEGAGRPVAPLGVDAVSLAPLTVDLREGPHFLITGRHGGGKSTLLQTWLLALATVLPPERLRLFLVDFAGSPGLAPLRAVPHALYVDDEARLGELIEELGPELQRRRAARDAAVREQGALPDEAAFLAGYPTLVMAVDDADQFEANAGAVQDPLEQLVRRQRGLGFHVLLAGQASDLAASYSGLAGALRAGRSGFVLGAADDGGALELAVPRAEAERVLPPGRGYAVRKGHPPRVVHVASAATGEPGLPAWLAALRQRWQT
jgi:S-DNA-T family DNA segregation ATPase FtsK/SpoIIIE